MKILFIFVCLVVSLKAEDLYISQNGAGLIDGSSCANAQTLAWATNAANWGAGAGKISAGDTVHFCGTITNLFFARGSGTPGAPITFLFEAGAKFSAPTWPNNATCIDLGTARSNLVVDGGVNGLIECTDNGSALSFKNNNAGVSGFDCSFISVLNLSVQNMFVRTGTVEQLKQSVGVAIQASSTHWSDLTVSNCNIGNCYYGVYTTYRDVGASNVFVLNNKITNCNWCVSAGDASAGLMTNFIVSGNSLSNWSVWDDTALNNNHHNGIYCYGENGGTVSGVVVTNNNFGPGYGGTATSGAFFSGRVGLVTVANNLFVTDSLGNPQDGHVAFLPYYFAVMDARVMNNTIVGNGTGNGIYVNFEAGSTSAPTTSLFFQNNLIDGVGTAIALFSVGDGTRLIDFNWGYGLIPGSEYCHSQNGSAVFRTLSTWQNTFGFDVHGTNLNPLLNSDYTLQASSPARKSGTNLNAYFVTDKIGSVRGNSWDIGAFQNTNAFFFSGVMTAIRGSTTLHPGTTVH